MTTTLTADACPGCRRPQPAAATRCAECRTLLLRPCARCGVLNVRTRSHCRRCDGTLDGFDAPPALLDRGAAAEDAELAATAIDENAPAPTLEWPDLPPTPPAVTSPRPPPPPTAPEQPSPTPDAARRRKADRRAASRRDRAPPAVAARAPASADRVLVMAPDAHDRQAVGRWLDDFGFRLSLAVDVAEAEALARRAWHAVVVLGAGADDDIDAVTTLCRRLRRAHDARPLALFAMLDADAHADRVRLQLAGADALLLRPPSRGDVARALEAAGVALPRDPRGAKPASAAAERDGAP